MQVGVWVSMRVSVWVNWQVSGEIVIPMPEALSFAGK
jgi:hypothetical protein